MSTEESATENRDAPTQRTARARTWVGWIRGRVAGFLGFSSPTARAGLDPRVANPNVHGRPRPVELPAGLDYMADSCTSPP